jgi:hypothetical protein
MGAGPDHAYDLPAGLLLVLMYVGVSALMEPWFLADLFLYLVIAKLVVYLFHRPQWMWRILALVLVPALIFRFFLPRQSKRGLLELAARE